MCRDESQLVAVHLVKLDQQVVLFHGPCVLLQGGRQVVEPTFTALFCRTWLQVLAHKRPVTSPVLLDDHFEARVLVGGPVGLHLNVLTQPEVADVALVCCSLRLKLVNDTLPAEEIFFLDKTNKKIIVLFSPLRWECLLAFLT